MIQELLALGFPIGKYILAAALMVAFYWFLFREKATFNNCRVYLLSIALVAILISQFSIVVYTPPAEIVEIEAVQAMPIISNNQSTTSQAPVLAANPKHTEKVAEPNKYLALLTVKNIVLAVYITVTSVLFILLFVQLFSILALKRRGKLTVKDGIEMVESAEIPTPFSFYKTIFLSPNLTGSKLEMILKHEQWHIKHRHYLDVFIIEILVRLFWFNPVLWWVRRELRNVSEFHADRSVLDEGQDLYKYQTVILEEVMENNPYLANGFNNSFTKKRFIMMKNKGHIRFATLRRALILPFFLSVFSLFCFSSGQEEVRYIMKNAAKHHSDTTIATLNEISSLLKTSDSDKTNEVDELASKLSNSFQLASKELNKLEKQKNDLTSMRKGMCTVCSLLDVKVLNNSVTENSLSDEFLSIITKDKLNNLSANLKERIKCIDKLKKEKSSKLKAEGLQMQALILKSNSLFGALLAEAMRNHINTENKDFKMIVQMTSAGIKLIGLNGCEFKEVRINPIAGQEVFVDKHGLSNRNSKASGFLFSIIKTARGLSFEGLRGTSWLKFSFDCTNGLCYQPIDQNGMCSLENELNKKTAVKDEKTDENTEAKSIDNLEDENSLNAVALFDKNDKVRKEAVDLLKDQNTIKQVALFDKNSGIRLSAVALLTDQDDLKSVALFDKIAEIRKQATTKLKDLEALKEIANFDDSPEVRLSALRSLKRIEENHHKSKR